MHVVTDCVCARFYVEGRLDVHSVAKVRDAIESVRGLMGTAGVFNYSASDHVGLDVSGFRMLEIRKGDWTLAK